ncbi:Arb2 domain-containing protein [Podospora appendiculata]|uniref:Arb2 domain-containing protein n=1 Tax=Podospora appendiculata TaxID=314037 RepID=A0AAE0XIL3_9PEZI|nr:Arb2 domain-containing protein [Podospora appendiculata]
MFRRRWSGLPADPVFPSNLEELGYFVNEVDEIRSRDDPDCYFKYFLTKNARWNDRQRFSFNEAIANIVASRLEAESLNKVLLPLGTTDPAAPHVKIGVSSDIDKKSRVVLIFGESAQEFGILAHRVAGGPGGIDQGSMVSLVRALKNQTSSPADASPPGIILANPGELWWWPQGKRGLTPTQRHSIPMSSAVHLGVYHDETNNSIPENRSPAEHVRHTFEKVVPALVPAAAKLDIIAVGDLADDVETFLDDEKVWAEVGGRLSSMTLLGGFYNAAESKFAGFKTFVNDRARAYMIHDHPLDMLVAGPYGNPKITGHTSYGCPVYSTGPDTVVTETMLITARDAVVNWIQEVANTPEYKNPTVEVFIDDSCDDKQEGWESTSWGPDEGEK